MGCTVCDSLDFHYFTSSNVGACFPPSDARARVTFRVSLQSWDGARKSASSVAPVNSGVYRERICEALLELLFYFIALLPLNPEERLKLSPSPGTVLATPNSPPIPPHLQKNIPKLASSFLAAYWIWSWTAELAAYQHVYRKQEHCKKMIKIRGSVGCWISFPRAHSEGPWTFWERVQVQMQHKNIERKKEWNKERTKNKENTNGGKAFHLFTGHTAFLTSFCKDKTCYQKGLVF